MMMLGALAARTKKGSAGGEGEAGDTSAPRASAQVAAYTLEGV